MSGFCPYLHYTGFLEYANNTLYFDSVKVVKIFYCGRENSCLGMKKSIIKIFDIINKIDSTKKIIFIEKTHICDNKLLERSKFQNLTINR